MGCIKKLLFRIKKTIKSSVFDTINSSTNTAFKIVRVSDNAESTFNLAEITNGTYDTWLSGLDGRIKEWIDIDNNTVISQPAAPTASQYLRSNSGSPYSEQIAQEDRLYGTHRHDLTNDWIVSVILTKELNNNNQRANIMLQGVGKIHFCMQLGIYLNQMTVVLNSTTFGINLPYNYGWNTIPQTDIFRLFTFCYIGGIFSTYLNNTDITSLGNKTGLWNLGGPRNDNTLILGSGYTGTAGTGKINKYKHLAVLTDVDLSSFDIDTYNTELMTRYSIV